MSMDTNTFAWYTALAKPSWAPPVWVFGPVWTFLYAIIAVTFGFVFYRVVTGALPWMIALPFALNLVFNFIFTPIQFGLQNNVLASLDILLVWGTLAWALYTILPHYPWVAYANVPYILWVTVATVLQLTITYLNF